jgi:hypothetical protein
MLHMSNMGFTCMLPFISKYAVVVNLLEQLQRRSDSSLRRRLGLKNLVQAAWRLALYMSGKKWAKAKYPYYSSLPILYRRETFDVVGCI